MSKAQGLKLEIEQLKTRIQLLDRLDPDRDGLVVLLVRLERKLSMMSLAMGV